MCSRESRDLVAHMVAQDAELEDGPVLFCQLCAKSVDILASDESHEPGEEGVLWPRQMTQRRRPPPHGRHLPCMWQKISIKKTHKQNYITPQHLPLSNFRKFISKA